MIISKKYAQRLIREGKANAAGTVNPDYPNDMGARYVAVNRYDKQRTDHYEDNQ